MWGRKGPQLGEHLPKIWGEDASGALLLQTLISADFLPFPWEGADLGAELHGSSRLLGSDASSRTDSFKGP